MTLLDYSKALFTADEFDRMAESGAFGKRRVALLEGEIIEMPAQGEPRFVSAHRTIALMNRVFGEGWVVRAAAPLRVDDRSQPEPDILVVRGDVEDFVLGGRPTKGELVIEISDSTLAADRKLMAAMYARVGIPEYWIVNLPDRQLEVFRNPDGVQGLYRDAKVVRPGESVAPLAMPEYQINPADLLPRTNA